MVPAAVMPSVQYLHPAIVVVFARLWRSEIVSVYLASGQVRAGDHTAVFLIVSWWFVNERMLGGRWAIAHLYEEK